MRTTTILCVLCACIFAATPSAHAVDNFGPAERSPSVLSYGFEGLGAGALVGLAGGYLAIRDNGWDGNDDGRKLGLGVGIGGLAGLGLGLGIGALDLGADEPGVGGIMLRDTFYGLGLGAITGLIGGGISAGVQNETEHLLLGASIGALAGAGVGLIVGAIEGPRIVHSRKHQARRFGPALASARDLRNDNVWLVGASGRF